MYSETVNYVAHTIGKNIYAAGNLISILRACWPSLQQIIDSRPVGKEAYPLKITLVFALAFAVASKRKFSPSTRANVGRRFEK